MKMNWYEVFIFLILCFVGIRYLSINIVCVMFLNSYLIILVILNWKKKIVIV